MFVRRPDGGARLPVAARDAGSLAFPRAGADGAARRPRVARRVGGRSNRLATGRALLATAPPATVGRPVAQRNRTSRSDLTVRLWRADGSPVARLVGHTCSVQKIAWSPDSRALATASCDGSARLWSASGRSERTLRPGAGAVTAVAWSPDSRRLGTGSIADPTDNQVHVWDVASGQRVSGGRTRFSGGKFYNLGWSPDGRLLAGGAVDHAGWDASGRRIFATNDRAACPPSWGFAWSPDADRSRAAVPALAWSARAGMLASGSLDGTVHLWTLRH